MSPKSSKIILHKELNNNPWNKIIIKILHSGGYDYNFRNRQNEKIKQFKIHSSQIRHSITTRVDVINTYNKLRVLSFFSFTILFLYLTSMRLLINNEDL